MTRVNVKWLILLAALSAPVLAQAECLQTVRDIKAHDVKTSWRETTANDGKPMTISIADSANGLVYSARKAGQPWLNGNVSVCKSGGSTAITLKNTEATSHVPALARIAMPRTQSAQIVGDQITLAGGSWSGTFVGQ